MNVRDLSTHCARLHACGEAMAWLRARDPESSAYDAWRQCKRADWLLWLAEHVDVDRRALVLAACDCAETVLIHIPRAEERPRLAIETARRWCAGEATTEEVCAAANAAYAAYANAAYTAYTAANAAAGANAAYAAYTAYTAANAAAGAPAGAPAQAAGTAGAAVTVPPLAPLVRRRIRWADVRAALEGADR